jgi:hypothetical protein
MLAGLISGCALLATFNTPAWSLPLGALIGIGYAFLTRPTERAYLESAVTAGAFGAPLWALLSVTIFPLLAGQSPQWAPDGMRSAFPAPGRLGHLRGRARRAPPGHDRPGSMAVRARHVA